MSEINRHRLYDSCMSPNREGAWVRYEDHAKLIAELEKEHTADVKLARFISFNLGKRWQAGAGGGGGYNPGISGGSGTIEANVTKGYLLDGTEVSVENLGAEGGVTIHPQPKFKFGDRVLSELSTQPWTVALTDWHEKLGEWNYRSSGDTYQQNYECNLTLYVPPTPAELIPTLKEHEWVRVTTTYNEKAFEGTVFFAHGAIMVGLNILAPNDSPPNPSITSIERCDAPEVK